MNDIRVGSITTGGQYNTGTSKIPVVCRSIDNGVTWNRYELSPDYGNIYTVLVNPDNTDIIYAGGYGYDAQLYKTTNGGADWTNITSTISGWIYALCFDPFNNERIYLGSSQDIYISTDAGSSWIQSNQMLSVKALTPDPNRPNKIFAGTSTGVFVSTDGGNRWDQMNDGLTYSRISCLELDPANNILFAGTEGCGVFRISTETHVEDKRHESNLPSDFILFQNYPNPFNASTEIRYQLLRSGRVNLSVFDINGRLIRNLVDIHQEAGLKNVIWDGKNTHGRKVSSGLYIYKLQTADFIEMKKMVLQQ